MSSHRLYPHFWRISRPLSRPDTISPVASLLYARPDPTQSQMKPGLAAMLGTGRAAISSQVQYGLGADSPSSLPAPRDPEGRRQRGATRLG